MNNSIYYGLRMDRLEDRNSWDDVLHNNKTWVAKDADGKVVVVFGASGSGMYVSGTSMGALGFKKQQEEEYPEITTWELL